MSEFDPTALDTDKPALPPTDELTELKERADTLGLNYHPKIGLETLRTKVNDFINGVKPAVEEPAPAAAPVAAAPASLIPTPAAIVAAAETLPAAKSSTPATPVAAAVVATPVPAAPVVETDGMKRVRQKREALKLIRVRITCMNPAKKEWEGEIFTVGNATIGTVKKFIPFNAEEGWHIPSIMLEMLRERKCQIFVTKKTAGPKAGAVSVREGKLIREFAIEVLPPLTDAEMADLAQRQAMSGAIQ